MNEGEYGLNLPAKVYPLFDNALRIHYERTHTEHRQAIGELFSGLTHVASKNPYAWFQAKKSAEELITPSAAVILTSVAKAKALGVSREKWVFLHGCADANDIWNISERDNLHTSPAMRAMATSALSMANKNIDDMAFFDIYSCLVVCHISVVLVIITACTVL